MRHDDKRRCYFSSLCFLFFHERRKGRKTSLHITLAVTLLSIGINFNMEGGEGKKNCFLIVFFRKLYSFIMAFPPLELCLQNFSNPREVDSVQGLGWAFSVYFFGETLGFVRRCWQVKNDPKKKNENLIKSQKNDLTFHADSPETQRSFDEVSLSQAEVSITYKTLPGVSKL